MNRVAQGIVLVLLGAAALSSTVFTDLYLNYVQPGFRYFLIGAGAVMIALGATVVAAEVRAALGRGAPGTASGHGHGHDHGGGEHGHAAPRVAWLLILPVVAVFVVAPPALGAYTAGNAQGAAPSRAGGAEPEELGDMGGSGSSGPVEMEIQEFIARAWTDETRSMEGRTIRLTGFAVPNTEGEGWYLARLQMACCAADAIVNRVLITNRPEPPEDSWWRVDGTWRPPEGDLESVRNHRFSVETMEEVENPPDPYE